MAAEPVAPAPLPPGPSAFFRRSYLNVLMVCATAYVVVAAVRPTPWVELPLGLLVLLLIPGYALGALALGPRPRWPWSLTFALVVAWSVAINVVEGLVLLLFGLGLPPLVLGLTAFLLIGAARVVWGLRPPAEPKQRTTPALIDHLRLRGYGSGQRTVAYALLVAIAVVLGGIVYLASLAPASGPAVSLGITGAGGSSSNLPPGGPTNTTLVIWVLIGNDATAQNFTLELRSSTQGAVVANYTAVPWSTPLMLGNGTVSDYSVSLAASANVTVHVQFEYAQAGKYLLQFLLDNSVGAEIRATSWPLTIS
jgi:uncharacterized membrane protein